MTSMVVHAIDGNFDFYWRIVLDQGGIGRMRFDRAFGASAVFDWRSGFGAGVVPTFVGCCGARFDQLTNSPSTTSKSS